MPHYGALDAICPETQFRLSHQSATGQEKLALVVWAVAYTWYQGKHLRITFVREQCGPRARAILDAFASIVFMLWFALIAWAMWLVYEDSLWRGATTVIFKFPLAPFQFLFFVVAGHFVLVALRSFLGAASRAARPGETDGETSTELEEWKAGRMIW